MTVQVTPEQPSPRKTATPRWALVPVGLLLSSVAGLGWMAAVAIRDPNFALERDYYQKAIHWDQTQAQAAINQHLAYRFALPSSFQMDASGHASIELQLSDRSGQPITGARVTAEAFANAFSGEISSLTFAEHQPGLYSVRFFARRAGLWEFRLSADHGAAHATAIERCELRPGAA